MSLTMLHGTPSHRVAGAQLLEENLQERRIRAQSQKPPLPSESPVQRACDARGAIHTAHLARNVELNLSAVNKLCKEHHLVAPVHSTCEVRVVVVRNTQAHVGGLLHDMLANDG
eukprot:CAMPEP_0115528810 /NCGR_PEP_ID=MMETSP0271-20121206/83591_1 /TAXON_ID=71861 /ORGANISM="Scrippsiella trochoidea, Strain CCMP3099" /LENGTH=113 /DNA_ID=CAMNT_0002960759 /DNA_START=84 /DNA_END=422 /DNA_ORIENTATION=+